MKSTLVTGPHLLFGLVMIAIIGCAPTETVWDVQVKQQNEIIEETTRDIERNPRNSVAYFNRGESHRLIEQYEQAISDFNKAIEINPKYARAYEGRADAYLGLAYRDLNQIDEAKIDAANDDLIKAEKIDPTIFIDHKNRGLGYISDTTNEFIYPAMSIIKRHKYGDLILGKTTIDQVVQMLPPLAQGYGIEKVSEKEKPVHTGAIGEVIRNVRYVYGSFEASNLVLLFDKRKILVGIQDYLPENIDFGTAEGKHNEQKIRDMMKHHNFVEESGDEGNGFITMRGKISPCVVAEIKLLAEKEESLFDSLFAHIYYYFTC